jgi:hypothetical protein
MAACLYHVSSCIGFHALFHLPVVVFSGEDNEYRTFDPAYTLFSIPDVASTVRCRTDSSRENWKIWKSFSVALKT